MSSDALPIVYTVLMIVACLTPHVWASIVADYRDDSDGGQLPTFASKSTTASSSGSLDAAAAATSSSSSSSLPNSNNIIRQQQQHHHQQQQQQQHLKEWNVDSSADDIRCFCNMPKCITAGYMCRTARSRHGGCYWEQRASRDQSMRDTRHGCLELLKDEYTEPKCNQTLQRSAKNAATTVPLPLLHCCHEDMCNHVDRPERPDQLAGIGGGIGSSSGSNNNGGSGSIAHINRSRGAEFIAGDHTATVGGYADAQFGGGGGNSIIAGGAGTFEKQLMIELRDHGLLGTPDAIVAGGTANIGHPNGLGDSSNGGSTIGSSNSISFAAGNGPSGMLNGHNNGGGGRDGWFRTATIIFPIGGAVILFVLIALAIRILRTDNADMMMDYHHHHHHHASKPSAMAAARSVATSTLQLGGNKHLPGDCDVNSSAYMINMHQQQQQQHQQMQQAQYQQAQPMLAAASHGTLLLHNNYRKAGGLGTPALIANDLRNVALPTAASSAVATTKKNHLKAFEYTLLPQRCCLDGQNSSLSSTSSSSSSSSSSSTSSSTTSPSAFKTKATNTTAAAAAAAAAALASNANVNLSNSRVSGSTTSSAAAGATAYNNDTKGCKVYQKETLSATPYWTTSSTPPTAK